MRLQQTLQNFRNRFKTKRRHQPAKKRSRRLQLEQLETRIVPTGTWQGLANNAPIGVQAMLLLSNGVVLATDGSTSWAELTPNSSGSYVNGTWASVASSHVGRTYFGSVVLPDGRVLVVGGELSSAGGDSNQGEIYDPVANTWTTIANYPETNFGDGSLSVLPDGRVLGGHLFSGRTHIYNPATDAWSDGGTLLNGDTSSEEGWVKLAETGGNGFGLGSGRLLSYEIQGSQHQTGQMYNPATNTWTAAGSVPVTLDTNGGGPIVPELGPSVLLPDGRVFWIGATNHTALYSPTSNSWVAGPDTPNDSGGNVVGGFDAPAAMEVNGKVLYAASPPVVTTDSGGNLVFGTPTTIYEYDPNAGTVGTTVAVPNTNGPGLGGPAFVDRMLVLPNGQILFTNRGQQLFAYTSDSGPAASWAPTVTNITGNTLTGTQLNGLSEGASYGDDAQMASNFPIIQLTDSGGTVRYARTSNWSDTGVATGTALVSTNFSMPGGAPNANLMNVVANGIASPNILYVTGTGGSDTITLDTFTITIFGITFNYISVNVNGTTSSWFAPGVSSVFVNGSGNDTINVLDTWAGIPTFINSGSGADTVNIGNGGSVQGIAGNVIIENRPSFDTININDSADGSARTTTIQTVTIGNDTDGDSDSFGQVSGLAPGVISYEYFDTNTVNISTGTGGNTINVLGNGTTTNLIGSFGGTTVNVGNAGSVQGIFGTLNFENPNSFDTINVDDSADGTARTTTLSTLGTNSSDSQGNTDPYGEISGLAPGTINYEYFDTSGITIHTGNVAGNIVNVQATGVTTNLVLGGNGVGCCTATVNVGNAGSVQGITGTLNIENPPSFNTITVDDSADGTARTTFLGTFTPSGDSNWGFISGLAPANINYEYFDTTSVTINMGTAAGNVVNVQATGTTTNLVGIAADTVNIGSNAPSLSGTLAAIAGPLNISNASVVAVDDSGDGAAQTATITNSSISGTWSPAVITYIGASTLSIHGGFGGDTINVQSTSATTNLILSGGNTVNVGNAGSVQGILGALNIENPPSFNTIVVDDSADTTARTVTLSTLGTNGSDSEGNADPWGQIIGLAPAHINYEYGDTSSLTVNGGTGSNTFNVQATGVFTTLNAGSANDTVNVGNSANSLDNIQGTLTVNGQAGTNTLNVNDQGSSAGNSYTVTSSFVQRTAATFTAPVFYSGLATLVLNGSSGGSAYNLESTAAGTAITVNGGAGNDAFLVSPSAQNFGTIAGPLSVNGGGGTNPLSIHDQSDAAADTYTIAVGSIQRTGSAGVTYSGITSVAVYGGSGGDTFNINSTAAGTPLFIIAGAGNDTFNLAALSGSLDNIQGTVFLNGGGGTNAVNVDDQNKSLTQTYAITATTVNRGGLFAGLTYASIQDLFVNGGTGADIYNILSTSAATTVNGGAASDTFNVGSGGVLDAILGPLTVNGAGGTNNVLNIDDHLNGAGQSFNLANNVLTRSGGVSITYVIPTIKTVKITAGTNNDLFIVTVAPTTTTVLDLGGGNNTLIGPNATNTWTITSANHGTLGTKVTFSNAQNLIGGTGNDTFKFSGAGASIAGNLNGGGGTADKLDYSLDGGLAISVNLATGVASRIGGTFSNIKSLVGSTAATDTLIGANITNLWSITGLNIGKVNTFSYNAIENLVGGTGLDTFKFSFAGKETSIVGGGAPAGQGDWLDYSSLVAPNFVTVDLATGTTAINGVANASVSGIQNVIGGAGNDILTGDSQGNILIEHGGAGTINGGTGRSLLIRGIGAATVNGGSSGDILIGGKTSYDTTNHVALMAILAEWQSADTYAVRQDKINDGTIPGGFKLLAGSTVTLTTAGALNAAPGADLDWFFFTSTQVHTPLEPGEVANNVS
jgi:hypothetical protein